MKIITADEFIHPSWTDGDQFSRIIVSKMMIEFAKLHVMHQQEAILEKLALRGEHSTLDKNIIANAYPLTNIK